MRYLIILAILFIGCQSSGDTLEKNRKAVMKVHDDAMARIGEINLATAKLKEMMATSPDSLEIRKVMDQLVQAEEGMMVWMEEYREPDENLKEFYDVEMVKITKVAEDIDKSLNNANKYVEK